MRSIKPGRGPSAMGGAGSIAAAVFGVFWMLMTIQMGAPILFTLFGVVFIAFAIIQAVYNFKNATGKNRYSAFDITDENEEPDPLNQIYGEQHRFEEHQVSDSENNFCPYCGNRIDGEYAFCNKCGKKLPE
jgi:hypothetical protein